jgi:2-polyprenyl-3-methyl-5-hydroxy-6-metoxy-1,4-benzoquinol methylase
MQSIFWDKVYSEGRDFSVIDEGFLAKLIRDGNISGDVLDVGCGTGDLVVKLAKMNLSVTGIDISDVGIDKAKNRTKTENVEVRLILGDINVVDEKFDAIFCKLVYAFVPNKIDFLEKIKDKLKRDGVFVLITPIINESNRGLEKKPVICATEDDIQKIHETFRVTKEYHTDFPEEGRIIKTFVCRK